MSSIPEFSPERPRREAIPVSELNQAVAGLLERSFPSVWVAGELSNFTRAASGHWYFTLKDARAQVRGVMFRGRNQYVEFQPREGDRVEVRATVSLYAPRGDFQLGVEAMRRAGEGDLFQAFLQLKRRLEAEGLFDAARKRPVPAAPRRIGVVTSLAAAALRDVLTTLARRAPMIEVVIYPAPVQGADAPARLVAALEAANARAEVDVLLLVRGGGSLEDLQAFNDERLARAVAASRLPVVAGVGHETDFTIADFVADLRAPTPTGAAAAASPDLSGQRARLGVAASRLAGLMRRRLEQAAQQLDLAQRTLRSPAEAWRRKRERLVLAAHRLQAAHARLRTGAERRLDAMAARLQPPRTERLAARLDAASRALAQAGAVRLSVAEQRLETAAAALDLVSPAAVMARGFAVVRDAAGRVLRAPHEAPAGTLLDVELAAGRLRARVTDTDIPAPGPDIS